MAFDPMMATGAGLALVGTLGPGIGVGLVGAKVIEGSARQPEMASNLFINGLIFAALAEALGLIAAVVGFKLAGFF